MAYPVSLLIGTWVLVALVAQSVVAQDPEEEPGPVTEVDPIVVTATRTEKDPLFVPAMVTVLDGRALTARRQIRTMPEALREVPGVMVQKTGHGQGSPFIRGFTGFRTLMLVDGIRLNNSVFRDGPNQYWNTVDPFSIERLEAVKGSGSVLWGSDAVGGTVHALSKRRTEFSDENAWSRRVLYRYASAEASHIGRFEVAGNVGRRIGVFLGGTVKDFGDLDGGRDIGKHRKTGYQEWDLDFKLEYYLRENHKLVVAHQRVDLDDAWRTHRTIFGVSWEGTTVGNELQRILDQDRDLTYAQYHATDLGGFVDAIRANVSWHRQEEDRNRIRSNGRQDVQGVTVGTVGMWVQLETPTDVGRFTYGIDYYHDNVNSFRRDFNANGTPRAPRIQGPVGDDADYHLIGLFVQDDVPVSDDLDIVAGVRYTYAKADADEVANPLTGMQMRVSEKFRDLSASLRATYRLDEEDRWFLFGGVSQAFRAPNFSDLTRFDSNRSNEIETPSPNLDPEKFLTLEVGLKTEHDDFSGSIAVFYTRMDDLIIRTPTGRVIGGDNEVTKQNSDGAFVYGVELSGRCRFHPEWTAFGIFTWLDGEQQTFPTSSPFDTREPLDRLMPPMGHVGVRWDDPKEKYWAEGLVTAAAKQSDLSTRDKADTQRIPPGGTPGYVVVTLRGGVRVSDHLDFSVAVENLANEDYRIHGSGVNEPGTNLVLTANVVF